MAQDDLVLLQETSSAAFREVLLAAIADSVLGLNAQKKLVLKKISSSDLVDALITTAKLADGAVTTQKVANDAINYAKLQNVSATDKVLGRSTAGAGDVEEIVCTAFARSLLDDATAADAQLTLGLGKETLSVLAQGRLSLHPTDPLADVNGGATSDIRYLPFRGDKIALWDGSRWVPRSIGSGVNLYTAAGSPNLSSTNNWDVFLRHDGNAYSAEFVAWSSSVARLTSVDRTDGVNHKSGDVTKRYLGTIRTVSGLTYDHPLSRWCWNVDNRIQKRLRVYESTASWTYTTATWRQVNNNAGNKVSVLVGLYGFEHVHLMATSAPTTNSAGTYVYVGIGFNVTNANSCAGASGYGLSNQVNLPQAAVATIGPFAMGIFPPEPGLNDFNWLEFSQAAGTTTWYGSDNNRTSGMAGHCWV